GGAAQTLPETPLPSDTGKSRHGRAPGPAGPLLRGVALHAVGRSGRDLAVQPPHAVVGVGRCRRDPVPPTRPVPGEGGNWLAANRQLPGVGSARRALDPDPPALGPGAGLVSHTAHRRCQFFNPRTGPGPLIIPQRPPSP